MSVEKVYSPLNPCMWHPFGCPFGTVGLLVRFNGSMCVALNGHTIIGNPWQWDLLVIGISQEFGRLDICDWGPDVAIRGVSQYCCQNCPADLLSEWQYCLMDVLLEWRSCPLCVLCLLPSGRELGILGNGTFLSYGLPMISAHPCRALCLEARGSTCGEFSWRRQYGRTCWWPAPVCALLE